jgi:hypothetical protein
VPAGPLTENERTFVVELYMTDDIVEFDVTEREYCWNEIDTFGEFVCLLMRVP